MSITVIFIIALAIIVTLFDVWVIWKKGPQSSISAYIIRGSHKYPLLVLLFGMVLGHLFWSMRTDRVYHNTECIEVEKNDIP
jgi:hypothetical protein